LSAPNGKFDELDISVHCTTHIPLCEYDPLFCVVLGQLYFACCPEQPNSSNGLPLGASNDAPEPVTAAEFAQALEDDEYYEEQAAVAQQAAAEAQAAAQLREVYFCNHLYLIPNSFANAPR
jgi:hypothetical protein